MWPDRVSNSGPLAHKSDTLPNALRGPASEHQISTLRLAVKKNTDLLIWVIAVT